MQMESLLPMIQISDSLFPIGAYTLSNGLETYVAKGKIASDQDLREYVMQYLKILPLNDLGVMALAYRWGDKPEKIAELDAYATAIKAPKEVRVGSAKLCKRFMKIWNNLKDFPHVYDYQTQIMQNELVTGNHSIAVGLYARDCNLDLTTAACIYTYNLISGIITNAVKSVPLSQRSGQEILQEALRVIPEAVRDAEQIEKDDLGVGGTEFDIYAMNHEYMYSRLYMS